MYMATRKQAIILVEDEPDILIILHRLMRDLTAPYDIVTVNGGAEALAHIALRPVALVITDYNMPRMNGIQLTAAIKEVAPQICVVMITAYATPDLEKRARESQVDFYLPKPFPLDRLEQIVRAVLRPMSEVDDDHLALLVRQAYNAAGAPYGNTGHGLLRWIEARLKI